MDVADLVDIFQAFGPVQVRRMFGGHGVYRDTLMFALESDGVIFLKADDSSKALFDEAGAWPFAYAKQGGRTVVMSFWSLPDAALDDPAEAARWADLALAAARRAQQAKMQRGMKPKMKPKAGAATRKR